VVKRKMFVRNRNEYVGNDEPSLSVNCELDYEDAWDTARIVLL
jgi:hypothetical protein